MRILVTYATCHGSTAEIVLIANHLLSRRFGTNDCGFGSFAPLPPAGAALCWN